MLLDLTTLNVNTQLILRNGIKVIGAARNDFELLIKEIIIIYPDFPLLNKQVSSLNVLTVCLILIHCFIVTLFLLSSIYYIFLIS